MNKRLISIALTTSVGIFLIACSGDSKKAEEQVSPAVSAEKSNTTSLYIPQEVLSFNQPLPKHVKSINGFGANEFWGRWSVEKMATVKLDKPLPQKFILHISGGAIPANYGKPMHVKVGGITKDVSFSCEPTKPTVQKIEFELTTQEDQIEFTFPEPQKVSQQDPRNLSIGIVSLLVEATK